MVDSRDDTPGHHPMTPLAAALWTTGLWLLETVCIAVTEAVRPGAVKDVVNMAACTALATSVAVFAMVRVHAREVSLRSTLGVALPGPLPLLLSVAAGAGLYPLLSTIEELTRSRWPWSDKELEGVQKLLELPTMSARIALVVSLLVVVPLARELFLRGLVYGAVKRATNVRTATLATAMFFAALEMDWRSLATTFVLGLALARLRERTGTVTAPVVATLSYGAVAAVPILRGRDAMEVLMHPMHWIPTRWIAGGAVIALLALAAVGASRRED
jgi:membrane protease YdiL (CAAX protease family)